MTLHSSEGTNHKVVHDIVAGRKHHPQSYRGMYGCKRSIAK
jgi:hypothetical protein